MQIGDVPSQGEDAAWRPPSADGQRINKSTETPPSNADRLYQRHGVHRRLAQPVAAKGWPPGCQGTSRWYVLTSRLGVRVVPLHRVWIDRHGRRSPQDPRPSTSKLLSDSTANRREPGIDGRNGTGENVGRNRFRFSSAKVPPIGLPPVVPWSFFCATLAWGGRRRMGCGGRKGVPTVFPVLSFARVACRRKPPRPTRLGIAAVRAIALAMVLAQVVLVHPMNAGAGDRPNIVLILADDLAWSDLGCYGHPWHETPHLDRLASEGMRFTDGYAPAPICSASRASILTGKSPARLGFEFVTKNGPGRQQLRAGQSLRTPPFTLNLPLQEITIAEHLRDAGYRTAFFGKWHLNAHHGGYLGWSPKHGPAQQGFQTAVEDFGSHPYRFRGQQPRPPEITRPGQFPSESMVDHAAGFMRESHASPFFLMVSHFYGHTPVATPCRWLLDKYAARIPIDSPNRERRIAYGAFVETLDHYVGQVIMALDRSAHADSTLVVFTSDNGGHPEYAANGPLRGSKWNLYEGGIRVPFLARWPGRVPPNSVCATPVIGYDLMPTLAEVAGNPLQQAAKALDGISLVSVLQDPTEAIDRALYWHFPYYHPERGYETSLESIGIDDFAVSKTRPHSAIRRKDWKLLRFYEDDRIALYDLSQAPGEQTDRSEDRPATAAGLQLELDDYLESVRARQAVAAESD